MIELADATADDLAAVVAAGRAYRQHWDSFRNMPDRGATFAGSTADVGALDYLDYEQLGHPGSDLSAASLVWGNVFVVQAGLVWMRAANGERWLGATIDGVPRGVLWPYARLAEAKARDTPQFGQFASLMQWVIEELLDRLDLPVEVHARLRRLYTVLEIGEKAVADAEPGTATEPVGE